MKRSEENTYRCPETKSTLTISDERIVGDEIVGGTLTSLNGNIFTIEKGIPDFTWPKELAVSDQSTKELYDKLANEYDKFASIPFLTFKEKEEDVRESMTDKLNLEMLSLCLIDLK